jgi:membrane-associated protein
MYTVNLLRHLVENHQVLVYLVILLGLVLEGELFVISAGILVHLGALDFTESLIFIFLGLLLKTCIGYYLGELIHSKWHKTRFIKYMNKRVLHIMPHFKKKPFWSIFISKFIMGANNIVIIFSGFHKVEFKKYLQAETLANVIWAPALLSIGYFFSYTALHVSHEVWKFSLIVLVLIILFTIFDKLISWVYEIFEEFYDNDNTE